MEEEWFYSRNDGDRVGPITGHQLKQAANRGRLDPDDMIWCGGWNEWHRASSVPWLIGPDGPIVRDDRDKGLHECPPVTKMLRNFTAVLIECKDCGRDHFLDCGPCPSKVDAAREVAMAERVKV